jgi:transcriptional regulator with XRE-family HTH domain
VSRNASELDLQREIGRRIQAARVQAGVTQEDAASAAKIDWRRWPRLENGAVNPTVRTLSRVAKALGLDFWALLGVPAAAVQASGATVRKSKRSRKRET